MNFKRALVGPQKGTFYTAIRRLLEAKRACIGFELHENSLQKPMTWESIVCRRQIDIALNDVYHVVYPSL